MLYQEGIERLNKEASIDRMVRHIREARIFMKEHHSYDEEKQFQMQYHHKNVIQLDDSDYEDRHEVALGAMKY